MKVFSIAAIREIEHQAMQQYHISEYDLMQRAAHAALKILLQYYPQAKKFLVVCGGGNNGGDGLELAKLLYQAGHSVEIFLHADAQKYQGPAKQAYQACVELAVPIIADLTEHHLKKTDILIDALFGIGLQTPLKASSQELIQKLNQVQKKIFSVDIPSGLNAETGNSLGAVIQSDSCVTFIGLKKGLLTGAAKNFYQQLFVDDLQLTELINKTAANAELIEAQLFADFFKPRESAAHKGNFGHVLIIGGAPGMMGAVLLAAEASLRIGAGLVTVATHPQHAATLTCQRPEIMVQGIESPQQLNPLLEKATVIAIGPGLGQDQWAKQLLQITLQQHLPKVIDADALNLLAKTPSYSDEWILTPHPGEAARLLQTETPAIQNDRFTAVNKLQKQFGGIVLLKGSGTLIQGKEKIYVCDRGNPAMATAGMGDCLTGIIAGLIAQKLSLLDAAALGAFIHGCAGDIAAQQFPRGLLASDLIATIPNVLKYFSDTRN